MNFLPACRFVASTALLALGMAAQANTYTIVDLGADYVPVSINDHLDIAGTTGVGARQRATVYHGLGHGQVGWEKLKSRHEAAFATSVGEGKDVVGAVDDEPVIWEGEKGPPVPLVMPADFAKGVATGVYSFNEPDHFHGIIVGSYISTDGKNHCFRTDDLVVNAPFPGQGDFCNASAISASLSVVGGANRKPGGPVEAFLWNRASLEYLGTLPGGNPPYSIAMAVHSDVRVVGCSNTADAVHAFSWHQGDMTDIGASKAFPGGTCAYGIDRNGRVIVGGGDDASGQPHALRFDGGKVIPLETEVEGLGGWTLQRASDVNEDGIIVGVGMLGGEVHGFKLVPTGER